MKLTIHASSIERALMPGMVMKSTQTQYLLKFSELDTESGHLLAARNRTVQSNEI